MIEIQLFEVCVVVGYASYSYCNEISQVQLYLKMLRLKHSGPVAELYLVYYNQWAVAGTDIRLYPRSRPALPDPV